MKKNLTKEEIELIKMTKSRRALEYFRNRINLGKIENADASLSYTGSCGETMDLYLELERGLIKDVKFRYDGCAGVACCGSAVCELAKGKTLLEAKNITQEDILNYLKALPVEDFDCPLLAVETLKKVIEGYEDKKIAEEKNKFEKK